MDDRQINRRTMYGNVLNLMSQPDNQAIFATLATIEPRHHAFRMVVDSIDAQALIQVRDTKGATAAKKQIEKQLEQIACKACENLLVFAQDTGLTGLAATYTGISISSIERLRDLDLIHKCQAIQADATTHAAGLAALKFSAADLASLSSLIVSYQESLSANPNLVAIRTAATDALLLLFPEAAEKLEKLTNGINLLKDDHPDIVALFLKTKAIKDLGS